MDPSTNRVMTGTPKSPSDSFSSIATKLHPDWLISMPSTLPYNTPPCLCALKGFLQASLYSSSHPDLWRLVGLGRNGVQIQSQKHRHLKRNMFGFAQRQILGVTANHWLPSVFMWLPVTTTVSLEFWRKQSGREQMFWLANRPPMVFYNLGIIFP